MNAIEAYKQELVQVERQWSDASYFSLFCVDLSHAKEEVLKDRLVAIFQYCREKHDWTLFQRLYAEFGMVFLENMRYAAGYSHVYADPPEFIARYEMQQLCMELFLSEGKKV